MKVFSVGIDEKSLSAKDSPSSPDSISVASTPIITFEKKRRPNKNYLICWGALCLIILFAIVMSEMAYSRAREDLRLRWMELKNKIGIGCDECMNTPRSAQPFHQQRFPTVLENSNDVILAAQALHAEPMEILEQITSRSNSTTSEDNNLSAEKDKPMESRFDFLRKIIPKIKEQAEKSGLEGVMEVKMLHIDSVEPNKNGFEQLRPVDLMGAPRPNANLVDDVLRSETADGTDRLMFNPQYTLPQNEMGMNEQMIVPSAFVQPQQLWPEPWGGQSSNILFSNDIQHPYPFYMTNPLFFYQPPSHQALQQHQSQLALANSWLWANGANGINTFQRHDVSNPWFFNDPHLFQNPELVNPWQQYGISPFAVSLTTPTWHNGFLFNQPADYAWSSQQQVWLPFQQPWTGNMAQSNQLLNLQERNQQRVRPPWTASMAYSNPLLNVQNRNAQRIRQPWPANVGHSNQLPNAPNRDPQRV
ncbi:unnamed protein product [Thelazia callipaeda]|uniref:Uncharacterized protein n=1 Tax=Thelazia callipaeda TaxID=103827 RepID=A0A0N5CWJ6_THECL|nr:unnamed protein product [Thelazia callipaeda]